MLKPPSPKHMQHCSFSGLTYSTFSCWTLRWERAVNKPSVAPSLISCCLSNSFPFASAWDLERSWGMCLFPWEPLPLAWSIVLFCSLLLSEPRFPSLNNRGIQVLDGWSAEKALPHWSFVAFSVFSSLESPSNQQWTLRIRCVSQRRQPQIYICVFETSLGLLLPSGRHFVWGTFLSRNLRTPWRGCHWSHQLTTAGPLHKTWASHGSVGGTGDWLHFIKKETDIVRESDLSKDREHTWDRSQDWKHFSGHSILTDCFFPPPV